MNTPIIASISAISAALVSSLITYFIGKKSGKRAQLIELRDKQLAQENEEFELKLLQYTGADDDFDTFKQLAVLNHDTEVKDINDLYDELLEDL